MIIAISHYDYGFDEAWYIHYAKNFTKYFIPFVTNNEEISLVDIISMFPYYLLSFILKFLNSFNYLGIKIFSSFISLISLSIIYKIIKENSNYIIAFFSILFICIQPGFGFIATSFFGEILAVSLVILGIHFITNRNMIYFPAIVIAIAIHTKFQLFFIIILTLTVAYFLFKDRKYLVLTFLTIVFVCAIILLRLIPILFYGNNLIIKVIRIYYNLEAFQSFKLGIFTLDKIQLFNRFFPMILFVAVFYFASYFLKNYFSKLIYIYSIIACVYWIFFFNFTTYRQLFLGLVPLIYLFVKWLYNYIIELKNNNHGIKFYYKETIFRFGVLLILLWGMSTNLLYAYIGYNDGVQIDLDGFKNRLFSVVKYDNSQKDFYSELINIIKNDDIIFSESPHLTKVHLDNRVYELRKVNDIIDSINSKYAIISRETFLINPDKEFQIFKDLKVNYNIILKIGDFYLLKIVDE